MSVNLKRAHYEWANRPADERFQTLQALKQAVLNRRNSSVDGDISVKDITVIPEEDNVKLNCLGKEFEFTNWSFNQFCHRVGAPPSYLRELPSNLVAMNLQYGITNSIQEASKVLISVNGKCHIRAFTSPNYKRIWDIELVEAIERLQEISPSWHNPTAYKINSFGREMENSGLYASDRDVFIFIVDEDHKIEIEGEVLSRGAFFWNSEVGKSTLGMMTFLYRYVCGNHIVWDAKQINEVRIVHKGLAPSKMVNELIPALKKYVESSPTTEVEVIKKAMDYKVGDNNEQVIKWLRERNFQLNEAESAVETANNEEGSSVTLWNVIQGITAFARNNPYLDVRLELERKVGKLLQLVA